MELGAEFDDGQLLARCRAGDDSAWRVLVERNARLVNGILRGAFRLSDADAEDAFQEVFTRVYMRLATVRDDAALAGWIAQVTRNVALDWLRRSGRERPAENVLDEAEYTEPLDVLESLTVREALATLPEHQQEVLDRFFVRDESYQTIGAALGIPPGTIASRISRALAALRVEVEGRSNGADASTA